MDVSFSGSFGFDAVPEVVGARKASASAEDEEDEDAEAGVDAFGFFVDASEDAAFDAFVADVADVPVEAVELVPLRPPLELDEEPRAAARWLSLIFFAPRSLRKSSSAFCGFGSSLPSDSRMSAWMSALGRGGAGDCNAAQKAL